MRVIYAQGRVNFALMRIILAQWREIYAVRRVICAQGRGIWEEIREGARGAAKGVAREIERLC